MLVVDNRGRGAPDCHTPRKDVGNSSFYEKFLISVMLFMLLRFLLLLLFICLFTFCYVYNEGVFFGSTPLGPLPPPRTLRHHQL